MSNLLKEAIVDAKALREAALKSAETKIIDKYSEEVRQTIDQLLEQPQLGGDLTGDPAAGADAALDTGLGGDLGGAPTGDLGMPEAPEEDFVVDEEEAEEIADDIPLAATDGLTDADGEGLHNLPKEGEKEEFEISLDALQEAISKMEAEVNEAEEFDFEESDLVEILSEEETLDEYSAPSAPAANPEKPSPLKGQSPVGGKCPEEGQQISDETGLCVDTGSTEEERKGKGIGERRAIAETDIYSEAPKADLNLNTLVDAITEKLTVDMGAELSGWAGRSDYDMKWEIEKELAHRRSTDVEEDLKIMKKAQEELVFENKQLKEQLLQYKQATTELKESLQDVNLSNARLLYTNRVLRNTSLNERQKERIVEAISRAGSVIEARTIFDTLQSTVESKPKHRPQSLSEAITRRSSVIRASRQESTTSESDSFSERMKRLAGIK